jgi:hypothetical protein
MLRSVQTELLDDLPPEDSAAVRSRRDLRLLNRLMGHASFIASELREHPSIRRLCDLGGGDGTLFLRVARQLRWRDVHLTLVDRHAVLGRETQGAFAELGWRVAVMVDDVDLALGLDRRFDAIIANLFLHHFTDEKLPQLFRAVASRCRLLIACEPRRSVIGLLASRSTWAVGCGQVTRHDAVRSVQAGFTNSDLTALWPDRHRWDIREQSVGLFSHLFVAKKL